MIRLAVICRDEAERLPALAERLGDTISDVAMLVDDRTADDTEAVAERVFPAGKGERFAFRDFAQARNELLAFAREGLAADDYLLLLDPDSLPGGELPTADELTEPAYSCDWRWHGETWPRVILLRADTPAQYEGAVHEVLAVAAPTSHLPGVWVDAVVTATRERLYWIEDILSRDAATSPRSAFYLAQTLADLGRRDEALCWYLRRAAMGHGWSEETFMATYLAGCLAEPLDWEYAELLWRRCLAIRPTRTEPLWQLARAANLRGDHSEALAHASLGLRMGRSPDTLRVNRWIEDTGLSEQFDAAAVGMLALRPSTMEHANG